MKNKEAPILISGYSKDGIYPSNLLKLNSIAEAITITIIPIIKYLLMSNFFIEMKLSSLTGLPKIDLTDIIAIMMPARIKRIENANNAKRVLASPSCSDLTLEISTMPVIKPIIAIDANIITNIPMNKAK